MLVLPVSMPRKDAPRPSDLGQYLRVYRLSPNLDKGAAIRIRALHLDTHSP